MGGLDADDFGEIKGAGAQDYSNERKAEGELVADHLRGGTQCAEKRIFVVGGPAGEGDSVDADGGNAEQDEQADVEIRDFKELDATIGDGRAEGDNGDRQQRAAESDERGEQIE